MIQCYEKSILDWALQYRRLNWSVIPIRAESKEPVISWKKYQTRRPNEGLLRKWFGTGNNNIAVVLGEVSNGLACRDFDTMPEYEKWANSHSDLAIMLPTTQTSDGRHVYFEGHFKGIRKISNGELRGSGGYCLLPPSVHPGGLIYRWVNPLISRNLIAINPEQAGFALKFTQHTQHTQQTKQTQTIYKEEERKEEVYLIINKTLPKKYKERNQKIFFLALYIRSLPGNWLIKPQGYMWAVREWHNRALPNIRTKEFLDSWLDFLVAWKRLRYGYIDPFQVLEFSKDLNPPKQLVNEHPKEPNLHKLCVWCRELHNAHKIYGSVSYLSCRTISKGLNISHTTGNKYFRILELEGYLEVVERGKIVSSSGGLATQYKYVGT